MRKLISKLIADERGTTAIEYGMIVSLVFLVALSAMSAFGHNATSSFITAANAINGAVK